MRRGELADLSELLARAGALVDGFESTATVPVAERPAFLVAHPANDPQPIIERLAGAAATAYPARAQKRALKGRRRCLPASGLQARQSKIREILAGSLSGVRAALASVEVDATDAALGLGLWGIDYDQRDVTLWGSSDRVHVDISTVKGLPLAWDSKWVAVEAITQGSVVEWDPDTYASRWRSVRGIPLVWTKAARERIIVGAVTLTSTQPTGSSIFDTAEAQAPGIRKTIDISLRDELIRLWD